MQFTPLHDRVLVRRVESEEKTKGGLIIPDTAKEKPSEGEVIAVGEGARKDSGELIPMAVKAGDRILFGKWSGTEVKIDGEELLIMKESDIMGIIDAFLVFDQIFILTNGRPIGKTDVLGLLLYRTAFSYFDLGGAAAVGWVMFALLAGTSLVQWRFYGAGTREVGT